MKKILFCLLISLIMRDCFAQKRESEFRFWEDSLIQLRNEVMTASSEVDRMSLNEDFMTLLESVLWKDNSFKFKWDSVKNFSVLTSPDNNFKIFTWFIIKDNYSYENFGFIHVYNDKRKRYILYPLYDKRHSIDYPATLIGDHNRWYGAVYYKIIPLEGKNKTYYTLLGWNGNNLFSNEKIIEILHFKSDFTPVFGANVFKNLKNKCNRFIMNYSKETSLNLSYANHSYNVSSGKRDPKTKRVIYETTFCDMIIFDELIPQENGLDEIPAFLVPESSLNQGFIQDNGKWKFIESVNGRNPDKPRPKYEIKNRIFYKPPTSN